MIAHAHEVHSVSVEFNVFKNKNFLVQIKSFTEGRNNYWNVYAVIFDTHPLFNDIEKVLNLSFHWGATYDKLITTKEARGNVYDWQKDSTVLKVGSDYAHFEDEYESYSPFDCIPNTIYSDAQELIKELQNHETH